jgi:beta-glucosidase
LDYAGNASSPQLSEDARIPPQWSAPPGALFRAGHVIAPWSIFVADDIAEVHLTTARQESPRGTVVASIGPDGSAAVWEGAPGGTFRISGRAADLKAAAGQGVLLQVHYRVDRAPEHGVTMGMLCAKPRCGAQAGAMLDVSAVLAHSPPATWQSLAIPLTCLQAAGADLSEVVAPFAVATSGRFALTIAEVSLVPASAAPGSECPGKTRGS